jgi:hypothetical protein
MADPDTLHEGREYAMASQARLPRDPEAASRALGEVQELLRRHHLVLDVAHRQRYGEGDDRHELVENLVHRQALSDLRNHLDPMHPADIAYILEALPLEERLHRVGSGQGRARWRHPARGVATRSASR